MKYAGSVPMESYLGSIIVNKCVIRSISKGQALLSAFGQDLAMKDRLKMMAMHSIHKLVDMRYSEFRVPWFSLKLFEYVFDTTPHTGFVRSASAMKSMFCTINK